MFGLANSSYPMSLVKKPSELRYFQNIYSKKMMAEISYGTLTTAERLKGIIVIYCIAKSIAQRQHRNSN